MKPEIDARLHYVPAVGNIQDDNNSNPVDEIFLMQKKDSKRAWAEHYLYMVTVSGERGGADSIDMDNIVHHALPDLMNVMRVKFGQTCVYNMPHA